MKVGSEVVVFNFGYVYEVKITSIDADGFNGYWKICGNYTNYEGRWTWNETTMIALKPR